MRFPSRTLENRVWLMDLHREAGEIEVQSRKLSRDPQKQLPSSPAHNTYF